MRNIGIIKYNDHEFEKHYKKDINCSKTKAYTLGTNDTMTVSSKQTYSPTLILVNIWKKKQSEESFSLR